MTFRQVHEKYTSRLANDNEYVDDDKAADAADVEDYENVFFLQFRFCARDVFSYCCAGKVTRVAFGMFSLCLCV